MAGSSPAMTKERLFGICHMSELIDLLARLVAIDSVNPDLVPGGVGEAKIAAFVADRSLFGNQPPGSERSSQTDP